MHREWEFYLLALEQFEADLRAGWEPPEDRLELFWFDYLGDADAQDSDEGDEALRRVRASWPELIREPRPLDGPESLYLLTLVFCHGSPARRGSRLPALRVRLGVRPGADRRSQARPAMGSPHSPRGRRADPW